MSHLQSRTPRGMTLPERGTKLLEEARRILISIDESYKQAQELRKDSVETIRIGLITDERLLRIEPLARQLSVRLPEVDLLFVSTKSEDFIQDMAALKINAGFYYGNVADPHIHSVKLAVWPMAVVYPDSWDMPDGEMSLKDFAEKPWIWAVQGNWPRQQAEDYFGGRGLMPKTILQVDHEELIGNMVQQGRGCSVLPEPAAMQLLREHQVKVWKSPGLTVELHFGFPKDRRRDPVMNEMVSLLQELWKV